MKKWIALLSAILMMTTLGACAATAAPVPTETPAATEVVTEAATEAPVDPTAGLPAPVITGVTLLNPHADLLVTNETTEQDSPSLVFRAWDGDPATSWKSWWYSRSNFSGSPRTALNRFSLY